jgi:hypothetical protein
VLRRNRLLQNPKAQLMVIRSVYDAEDECFEGPAQAVADFVFGEHYAILADYQRAKRVDLHARTGSCGSPPTKVDVHKLHAETTGYAERARAILAAGGPPVEPGTTSPAGSSWWRALLGR